MLEKYYLRCSEKLRAKFEMISFAPDETVIPLGSELQHVYLITKGRAEIIAHNENGKTMSYGCYTPWELLGELELFAGCPTQNTIRAVTRCELLKIYRDDFFAWLESDPELTRYLFVMMSERFLKLSSYARVGIPGMLMQKIAYILLQNEEEGQPPLSKQALAERTGTSMRSLNRVIKKLRDDGIATCEGTLVRIRDHKAMEQVYRNR